MPESTPPDDTTAPVTAEGLRERIAEAATRWALMYPIASWRLAEDDKAELLAKIWGDQIANAVIAELAGDPGDLPARMAATLLSHEWDPNRPNSAHRRHGYSADCAICDGDVRRIVAAALSVRDERVVQVEARAEHAEGELSALRSHETRWELEHRKRTEAEAAIERVKALAERWGHGLWAERYAARDLRAALAGPGSHEDAAAETVADRIRANSAAARRIVAAALETPHAPTEDYA